jgi:hypothetical protein
MDSLRTYRVWLCVAVLLLISVGWMVGKPSAAQYPPFYTGSAHPNGTKAVATLLEEKGKSVKEWRQPLRFLPTHKGQALVVIEPNQMTTGEQEDILSWVDSGNDLILFEEWPADWEGLPFQTDYADEENSIARNIMGPLLGEGHSGEAQTMVRLREAPGMEVLLYDDQGILAGKTQVGSGTVTLFLVPEWMTNGQISRHSHFESIWPYLQEDWSVIWMDEYHHGLQQKPGLLAIYPGWLIAGCAQLALALLLWLWWRGKRFGPIYTLREWTVRRGDETLLAVSRWYERKQLARDALHHRENYIRQLMHDRWGLHRRADRMEIIRLARTKWNEAETGKLTQALDRLEQAKSGARYTQKQLLADSLLLDEITNRLEKE